MCCFVTGDKIIINVNFKKEDTQPSKKPEESNCNKVSTAKSSSKAANHNVDISSPQSDSQVKRGNSIASPNDTDEFEGSSSKPKLKSLSGDNLKDALSDEFKFLPRIFQNNEPSNSVISRDSSPNLDDDDSFLPTPTQDESHSPILNCLSGKQQTAKQMESKKATSKAAPKPIETFKDDFYDPELPLESPDRESLPSPPKPAKEKVRFDSFTAKTKKSPNVSLLGQVNKTRSLTHCRLVEE